MYNRVNKEETINDGFGLQPIQYLGEFIEIQIQSLHQVTRLINLNAK